MENNELRHWGIIGQKKGIRRFQNKDGTLTPEGRLRYLGKAREYERKANTSVAENYFAKSRKARLTEKAKELRREVKRSDLTKARAKNQPQVTPTEKKKTLKDMTDAELKDYVERYENRIDLEKRYNAINPKQVSTGKKFVKYIGKDILLPSVQDLSKQATKSLMTKGVNEVLKKLKLEEEYKTYTKNKPK